MTVYVTMGNAKYYGLLDLNITQIRKVTSDARILVYDWGDESGRPHFISSHPGVEIVDWTERIADLAAVRQTTSRRQQLDLAMAFNARFPRTLRQRIRKMILKRMPGSPLARPLITAGLTFENMLLQKIPCMLDASARAGDQRLIFLDADAFLMRSVEVAWAGGEFDMAVTLVDQPEWAENRCSVINSGVILFGRRRAHRDALLSSWISATETCREQLREQTALVRLLAPLAPALFTVGNRVEIELTDKRVQLLSLPCREFNNTSREEALTSNARVVHLANAAHNLGEVSELLERISSYPHEPDKRPAFVS